MKKYEMMIIFDHEIPFDDAKKFVHDTFNERKITIKEEKDYGLRDLAYPINKKSKGHYYLVNVEAEPSMLKTLNGDFKLYNGIIRHLTTNKEK